MAAIEEEFGRALEGNVKRKRNAAGKLRSKAARVVGGAPEVMVKVTSYGKGAGHVKAHLDYITRNGKVEMENDRGEVFKGKDEVKAFFKDWEHDLSSGRQYKERRDTMHLMLSMPANTPPEAVKSGVREFTKQTFGQNHEYAFALHTDEPHPHCHVTVKMLGHNGKRLNPGRKDLADWREDFAQAMRDQGVDAEATRRKSRGVVKKAENSIVRHIELGDRTHKPRHSRVKALRELEAIKEIEAEHQGQSIPIARPWEEQIRVSQKEIRIAWLEAAIALEQDPPKPIYRQPKEQCNERPDYANLNTEHITQQQRFAAVYQSNLAAARSNEPPKSITRLRDLSGVAMVHHERADQVLLQPHASSGLGWGGTADSEMRRSGIGAFGAHGGAERLGGYFATAHDNKALAGRIRDFVEAMPNLDTERHEIKRELVQRFSKTSEQMHDSTVQRSPQSPHANISLKNGAEQAMPKQRGTDVER